MASVIKEIARKLTDGSYENIAIGAKAENVVMLDNSTVEAEINSLKNNYFEIELTAEETESMQPGDSISIDNKVIALENWERIFSVDYIKLKLSTGATIFLEKSLKTENELLGAQYTGITGYTIVSLDLRRETVDSDQLIANLRLENAKEENLSAFENDVGFVTNTVNNLTNYYKKTETYTQEEINNLLNAITTLDIQVITAFPENPSKTTIYLKGTGTDEDNDYEEWLYTDSGWELIGTTEIDLTNYYTKTEVDTSLQNAINNIDVSKDWNENNSETTAYIQNRTHYVDGIEEIATITYSFEANTGEPAGENSEAFERWSPDFVEDSQFLQNIEEGKVYNIIWDGQLYECVPHMTGSRAYFGNLAIPMIGPDTGEPFCIVGRGTE